MAVLGALGTVGAIGSLLQVLIPVAANLIAGVRAAFLHVKIPPQVQPPIQATIPGVPAPPPAVVPTLGQTQASLVLEQLRATIERLTEINAPLPDGTLPSTVSITDDALRVFIESMYQQVKPTLPVIGAAPASIAPVSVSTPAAAGSSLALDAAGLMSDVFLSLSQRTKPK
jgi:hypothetical protein